MRTGLRPAASLAAPLPGWLAAALVAGTLAAVVWLERRRPLRPRADPAAAREARNLALAALSAAAIRVAEKPLVDRLAVAVHERRAGLVPSLRLPPALEVAVAVVLLDATLWVWHVLAHRVPLLWRFHRVHHADRDLTATTALRFHFAEMLLSVPWRAAQVVVVGAAPRSLSVWQTATAMAILFHHANVELPLEVERALSRVLMTPRLHGIHHSSDPAERESNWATILALPDLVCGTARRELDPQPRAIGVPELPRAERLGVRALLALPLLPAPPR